MSLLELKILHQNLLSKQYAEDIALTMTNIHKSYTNGTTIKFCEDPSWIDCEVNWRGSYVEPNNIKA